MTLHTFRPPPGFSTLPVFYSAYRRVVGMAAHAGQWRWGAGFMLASCVCGAHAAAAVLPEVTITARGDALAEQRAALGQKLVLDRNEIASLGGLSVGEVIRKLPGVEAGDQGGEGGMSARTRGMSTESVQFLVNGERPTANARFALTQIARLPAGELERIEILRGASAEFGGAAAVTVNLVMRRPSGAPESTLKLSMGQRGKEPNVQFSASRSGGADGFAWLLPVTINRHDMPVVQDWQRHTQLANMAGVSQQEQERGSYVIDEFILSPRLAWKSSQGQLTLWPSYYRNDGRRTSERRSSSAGGMSVRRDHEDSGIRILRLRLEGEQRLWGGKLSGRAALMDGQRNAERRRQVLQGSLPSWEESERRDEGEFSASLRHDRAHGQDDRHLVALGVDLARHRRDDRQQLSGVLSGSDDFAGREQQWSLWAQDEWRLEEDLALTMGLRGQRMQLQLPGWSRQHGSLDPSVALRWQLSPHWVARTSVGGSIRFPKLEELSQVNSYSATANSPLEPDRSGNPDLRPERIRNLEAGVEYSLAKEAGVLGANAYLRRTRDFIERRQTLAGARWQERPDNIGLARHWGVELSAKLRGGVLPASASLRASLTLPRGEVDDQRLGLRRTVRDMPSHNMTLGYEQSLSHWQSSFGFQLQRSGTTRSQVADEYQAQTVRRTVFDAHVVRRLNAQLNLRLAVNNLLRADTERIARASVPGNLWSLDSLESGQRTWLLSLEGKW